MTWYQGIVTKRNIPKKEAQIRFFMIDPKEAKDDNWYPYSEIFLIFDENESGEGEKGTGDEASSEEYESMHSRWPRHPRWSGQPWWSRQYMGGQGTQILDKFDEHLLDDTVPSSHLTSAENWEMAKQKVQLSDQQTIRGMFASLDSFM
jgi:hypothetical protein